MKLKYYIDVIKWQMNCQQTKQLEKNFWFDGSKGTKRMSWIPTTDDSQKQIPTMDQDPIVMFNSPIRIFLLQFLVSLFKNFSSSNDSTLFNSIINTLCFFFSADRIPFNHSSKRCRNRQFKLVILKHHSTCLLTMAPSWLPCGRLWKYLSDSSSGTFSTDPSTLTCIPHISQLEPVMCSFIGPVIQRGSFYVPSVMTGIQYARRRASSG